MLNSQQAVCTLVMRHMQLTGAKKVDLAAAIGLPQSTFSQKINGARRWSIADLDALYTAGVQVVPPAVSLLALGGGQDD